MTFPVKKERKSGFLVPTYGTTSQGGLDISLPYYFNLAPNYDMTLVPRYFSKRDAAGGEFRYLGSSYAGSLVGTYLPSDQLRDRDRWMFRSVHQQILGNGFYTDWDYAKVSDNDYFRDISQLGLNQASTTHSPQRGRVGWSSNYWSAYAQVYKYQTLKIRTRRSLRPTTRCPSSICVAPAMTGAALTWTGLPPRCVSAGHCSALPATARTATVCSPIRRFRIQLSGPAGSLFPRQA